jgi:sec-independent protein translocase protein TatC
MAALPNGPDDKRRNSSGDPEEFRATLTEHLEELRDRIVRSLFILCAGWVLGWFAEPFIYSAIEGMVEHNVRMTLPQGVAYTPAFRDIKDPFMLQLKLSFMIGLIPVFPLIVLQVWGFVSPGLKPSERKPFRVLAPLSVLLFTIGASFAWFIMPAAIRWFAGYLTNYQGTSVMQEPGVMVFFLMKMMLAFGIGFQLPLIVYALGALGLLSAKTLMQYWRQSSVVIFIASAVLTPSNDAFSMLMMAVPLCILFIISVYAVKLTQRKRARQEEADVYSEDLE